MVSYFNMYLDCKLMLKKKKKQRVVLMGTARCPLTTTFDFFLYNFVSFSIVLCHIFQCRVNFIERKKY